MVRIRTIKPFLGTRLTITFDTNIFLNTVNLYNTGSSVCFLGVEGLEQTILI